VYNRLLPKLAHNHLYSELEKNIQSKLGILKLVWAKLYAPSTIAIIPNLRAAEETLFYYKRFYIWL
jgi:hypothetical protein